MNVLISGGGIAGLTLALCLQRRGHEPLVVERSPQLRDEGYMIDFLGAGYDASEKMNILPDLERIHYQIPRLAFVDSRGKERFSVDYATLRNSLFGGRHFNFMRGDLERLLYSKIVDHVAVRFGTEVESFEQDEAEVMVKLTDGTAGSFDLLVGADGLHSHIRELAFGEERCFSRSLGYYTAAFVVDDPGMRESLGDAFYTLTVPGRQVAIYPIRGGRLAAFFIHRASRALADFGEKSARRELREEYGGMDWIVPELLARVPSRPGPYFDEVAQIEMPSWSMGRVALVGDACGCVSPLGGQGASLAMATSYVLAEELGAAPTDIAAAMGRYERRLRPAVEKVQNAGRRFAKWFVPENHARLVVRDAATRLAANPLASLVLKHRFAWTSTTRL
jgi:2-polyprenyl-6-methoxyphenol hydroxylase-like FAD-dependent oxidoreductase